MSKNKSKESVLQIAIDPNPKGQRKCVGGAEHDQWNDWLARITAAALPVNQNDDAVATEATAAVFAGMIDLKPADPIEGIIISQLIAAHQASLAMYRRAWALPPEHLEARMKYLTQADKAARTAMMLTEWIDHHRNQGKQQIVVQHTTTVNADQAVITDSVVTGKDNEASSAKLRAAVTDEPMEILDP